VTEGDDTAEAQSGKRPARVPSVPPRASVPPRPSLAPRRSQPPRAHPARVAARVAFAVAWVALQLVLVLTADRRPDGAFGFRMFNESSTIRVSLFREVASADGARVRVDDGTWTARDASGTPRSFRWVDRVRRPELAVFDREISASYGASAQLSRFQAALDDVAAHIHDDDETRRLLLDVVVRRNGREPEVVHLVSAERAVGGGTRARGPAGGR